MILKKFLCYLILLPFKIRYKIKIINKARILDNRGILLLGNHISWIDWAILQLSFKRCIRFVMNRDIYNLPLYKIIFKIFKVIPISPNSAKDSIKAVREALKNKEAVCIFPEGTISYTGNLNAFKKGFELTLKGLKDVDIIPFYIKGLWGSRFSRALNKNIFFKREITIVFGANQKKIDAFSLGCKISELSCDAYKSENPNRLYENRRVLEILNIIKNEKILSSFKEPFFDESICKNIKDYKEACKKAVREGVLYLFVDKDFIKNAILDENIHPLFLSEVKYVFTFDRISSPLIEAFERKFKKILYMGYKHNDIVITLNLPDVMETRYFKVQKGYKSHSFGKPIGGASVMIKKEKRELLAGEVGEVWVKSYKNDWIKTNDFGYLDKECFLYLR